MNTLDMLQQLTQARGPSGGESDVGALIAQLLQPLCQEVTVDAMGNVLGFKPGHGPEPRPRVMLMAHLDEIHLTVSAIEGPFLRFVQYSYDPRVLVGAQVVVMGREPLFGIIGDLPPHLMSKEEREKMPKTEALVIDLGLEAAQVAELVRVGDQAVLEGPLVQLLDQRVASKALDNRLMVTTMLATLDQLQHRDHPCDVVAVASVGEEYTGLGAQTATFALEPDLAIAMDVTFARQPGTPEEKTFPLGSGPAIGLGPNLHPVITQTLLDLAENLEVPHAVDILPASTGTDAWHIQVTGQGVPTGLVSIPIRNMHTAVEVADLQDIHRTARLLAEFLTQADATWLDSLTFPLPNFVEAAS